MSCGSLDGRGSGGRMNTCICMAEFLCCSPETVTIMLTSYNEKKVKVLVIQSCPTLCDPMDCSLPGSSVRGILQAIILEWVTIPFFRGSSRASNWTQVSSTAGRFSTVWAAREAQFPITVLTQSTTLPLIHCIPSRLASWLSLSMLVTLSSQGICLCHSLICQLSPSRFFFMPWSFTSFIVLLECHLLWGLP